MSYYIVAPPRRAPGDEVDLYACGDPDARCESYEAAEWDAMSLDEAMPLGDGAEWCIYEVTTAADGRPCYENLTMRDCGVEWPAPAADEETI